MPIRCEYLGEPTRDTVKVFGDGCPSERRNGISVTVCECALFGRCTVWPRGHVRDVRVRVCHACACRKGEEWPADHPTPVH